MSATSKRTGSKLSFATEIDDAIYPKTSITPVPVSFQTGEDVKKKAGRPSHGAVKRISLAIPADLYDGVETGATLFFKGNKTAYINALIKKDLDANLDKYNEFKSIASFR